MKITKKYILLRLKIILKVIIIIIIIIQKTKISKIKLPRLIIIYPRLQQLEKMSRFGILHM